MVCRPRNPSSQVSDPAALLGEFMLRPSRRWPGRWFPGRPLGLASALAAGPPTGLAADAGYRPGAVDGSRTRPNRGARCGAAAVPARRLRTVVEQVARQDHMGGDAPVRALAQLDAEAVPLRETADDIQAYVPRGGRLEYRWAPQPGVDIGQLVGGDADAGVLHGQHQRPVSGPFGPHDDHCALRRLGRGVVQQLGQDVTDVVAGRPATCTSGRLAILARLYSVISEMAARTTSSSGTGSKPRAAPS